jgi:hypothetical protein
LTTTADAGFLKLCLPAYLGAITGAEARGIATGRTASFCDFLSANITFKNMGAAIPSPLSFAGEVVGNAAIVTAKFHLAIAGLANYVFLTAVQALAGFFAPVFRMSLFCLTGSKTRLRTIAGSIGAVRFDRKGLTALLADYLYPVFRCWHRRLSLLGIVRWREGSQRSLIGGYARHSSRWLGAVHQVGAR